MWVVAHLVAILGAVALVSSAVNVISDFNELSYDENDRLTTNYLLYTGGSSCDIREDYLDYRPVYQLSPALSSTFFESNPVSGDRCGAVCLQRGTLREHIPHPLPKYTASNLTSVYDFVHEHCQPVEVGFLSYNPNVATIFWIDSRNRRVSVGTLKHGEKNTVWQTSYLGHKFVLQDSVTKEDLLELTVTHDAVYHIGDHKSAKRVSFLTSGVRCALYKDAGL
jgi:hypothetical protein